MDETFSHHKKSFSTLPPLRRRPQNLADSAHYISQDSNNNMDFKEIFTPLKDNVLKQFHMPASVKSIFQRPGLGSSPFDEIIKRDKPKPRLRISGLALNEELNSLSKDKTPTQWNPHGNSRTSFKQSMELPQGSAEQDYLMSSYEGAPYKKGGYSLERPRHLQKSLIEEPRFLNKKYFLSKKVFKEYEATEPSTLSMSKETKKERDVLRSGQIETRQRKPSFEFSAVDVKQSLNNILKEVENAILNVKNQQVVNKILDKIEEIGLESQNTELYKGTIKLHAKAMIAFSDIYKALGIFKNLKQVAESSKDYETKLIVYKHLGKCFQKIGNHKMATFYFVKLLQMSWVCNSGRYELLAYDLIGLQHFYLGDLERARFYHNKSVEGRIEPKNSELRKGGMNKILYKMAEGGGHVKKIKHVKTIAEELEEFHVPLSEDDFELPPQEHHKYIYQSDHKESNWSSEKREKSQTKKKFIDFHDAFLLKKFQPPPRDRTKKKVNRPRFFFDKEKSLNVEVNDEVDRQALEKHQVYLSHLSPNRLIHNFNQKDAKDVVNDYLAKGNGQEGHGVSVDGKEAEKLKKRLLKFKKNIELALEKIVQLDKKRQQMESKSNVVARDKSGDYLKPVKGYHHRYL